MSQEIPFLEKVADKILNTDAQSLLKTAIVLPNNRSAVFLKNHLANKLEHDFWLPDFLTIDEMMVQFSELNLLDPLAVQLHLFEVHKQIEMTKARSLDEFMGWAPIILNDFSELDFYLADAAALFRELSQAKAMEKWNLDGKPLTQLQTQYLDFFHGLYDYYQLLQERLLKENSAYKGMAYRRAAEKALAGELAFEWNSFVFVGFNALTEAEKTIVQVLRLEHQVEYLIDADHFYLDTGGSESLEAGRFLREALRQFKINSVSWVGDYLLEKEKNVEIVEVGKNMGQVKYAAQKLKEWFSNPQTDAANTAVVLMDENLLVPFLSVVPLHRTDQPEIAIHYNVTMGYPLAASPFADYIQQWLKLLIAKSEDAEKRLWVPGFIQLLNNPLVGLLMDVDVHAFLSEIKKQKLFFQDTEEWLQANANPDFTSFINRHFVGINGPSGFLKALNEMLLALAAKPEMADPQYVLLRNQLLRLIKIVKMLNVMLAEHLNVTSFNSLQNLFERLITREEISLKGEPLSGVQVMGLLETRNLDFENIIFLGANEGMLPKTAFQDSFIPFDLRRAYQLPLPNTKTNIVAYHFYRFMQRAQNVVMIYNSEAESLGAGQASRFILQMEHVLQKKNPLLHLEKRVVHIPIAGVNPKAGSIEICKDDKVFQQLGRLAERGISPSAITTFIRCPLQFYFSYLLRPKLPEQLETNIESNTFGSVVHACLESLYQDFIGKEIIPDRLLLKLDDLDEILLSKFTEFYGIHKLSYGKNLLIVQVAKTYIRRFVKNDIREIKRQPRILVALEQRLESEVSLNGKKIKIKGFIDRIDRQVDTRALRIVDYKTGKVNENELKIKNWDDLLVEPKFAKALQVLMYQWLYQKNHPDEKDMSAGLISLRSAQSPFLPVRHDVPDLEGQLTANIESVIHDLLTQIYDPAQAFMQTADAERCSYCDYQQLCMR